MVVCFLVDVDWCETRSTVAPKLFFNEIAGFETNSRQYLLKYGAPCHLDLIVPTPFASKKKVHEDHFFSWHDTFSC